MPSPVSVVERQSRLPVSAEEAFAWHARPGALERLAPPWERLDVLELKTFCSAIGVSLSRVLEEAPLPSRRRKR